MIKRGVSVQWFLGCSTPEERQNRKALVEGASPVLDVLLRIVEKERNDLQTVREADYADSAWAFKQAHLNGRIEELDRLLLLIRSGTDQE